MTEKGRGKIGWSFGIFCYSPLLHTLLETEVRKRMPRRGSWWTRCCKCVRLLAGCMLDSCGINRPIGALGMLTKWFHSTRLETRTKESNMYASVWVVKPERATKVRGCEFERMQHRPTAFRSGSRRSTHDGTRKMVNFACAG